MSISRPHKNRLIASLPADCRQRLLADCEQVELLFGEVINKQGEYMRHVYFPIDSYISLMMPMGGSHDLEVALVGEEGMYGIPLTLGVDITLFHNMVQGAGLAWSMDARIFQRQLKYSIPLQQTLHRYTYVVMRQLAQTAACNRFHLVEQRLARWILMCRDRAHSNEFYLTHTFLAGMLGVRRVSITNAAVALQSKKLIHYNRGKMQIIDPSGLEGATCSCYQSDKDTYDRILHT